MQISFFRYSALHLSGQSWCAFELLRTILIQQFCLTWILSLISSCLSRKNFFPFFWGSPFRQTATTLLPSSSSAILNVWNLSVREKNFFLFSSNKRKKGKLFLNGILERQNGILRMPRHSKNAANVTHKRFLTTGEKCNVKTFVSITTSLIYKMKQVLWRSEAKITSLSRRIDGSITRLPEITF